MLHKAEAVPEDHRIDSAELHTGADLEAEGLEGIPVADTDLVAVGSSPVAVEDSPAAGTAAEVVAGSSSAGVEAHYTAVADSEHIQAADTAGLGEVAGSNFAVDWVDRASSTVDIDLVVARNLVAEAGRGSLLRMSAQSLLSNQV